MTVVVCGLTGNGAEVEVVSDDLLVVVVHGALGEAQVEVVPQVLVNDPPWKQTTAGRDRSEHISSADAA